MHTPPRAHPPRIEHSRPGRANKPADQSRPATAATRETTRTAAATKSTVSAGAIHRMMAGRRSAPTSALSLSEGAKSAPRGMAIPPQGTAGKNEGQGLRAPEAARDPIADADEQNVSRGLVNVW